MQGANALNVGAPVELSYRTPNGRPAGEPEVSGHITTCHIWYNLGMEKTTVYLPQDLHSALKSIAHRQGRPQAEIIREALSSYVARQDRPQPTSWGSGENDEIRGADAEDWLDAHWKPDW